MGKKKLIVGIGSLEFAAKDFVKVWHQVEVGAAPKDAPIEKISFASEELLFKVLTPKRRDLLRYVHMHGKTSIRALSQKLKRDYSNVHQDVSKLFHLGVILKNDKDDKYYVPWDMIVTEIPLTSTAVTKNVVRRSKPRRGKTAAHAA